MQPHHLNLIPLDGTFAIAKLPPDAVIPSWASSGPFFSITRTADEVSIVCPKAQVPPGVQCERGWRCLRVAGTMDFSTVGVLASLVGPLAEAGISVFVVSTFDTDFLLGKEAAWERGGKCWWERGTRFEGDATWQPLRSLLVFADRERVGSLNAFLTTEGANYWTS